MLASLAANVDSPAIQVLQERGDKLERETKAY